MENDFWVKWVPGDFLHGVSELEANEGWVYTLVLNLIYDGRGPWPLDLQRLARRARLRPTSTQKALNTLYSMRKLALVDGCLTNPKAEKLIKSRQKVSENSTNAATIRWEKEREKTSDNNDGDDASALQPQSDRNAILEARSQKLEEHAAATPREGSSDWPTDDARQLSALLVAEAHTVKLDPSRQPGLVTSAGRIAAWQRAGFSWTDVVRPVVTELAQRTGRPITSWSYFDNALAERHALNNRPIPEAEIDHDHQPARRGTQRDGHEARRRGALAFLDEQRDDSVQDQDRRAVD